MSIMPVKIILEGIKYSVEVLNFTFFIYEEAIQTGIMAFNLAIDQGNTEIAGEMLREVVITGNNNMQGLMINYGISLVPSWSAFAMYGLAIDHLNGHWSKILSDMEIAEQNGILKQYIQDWKKKHHAVFYVREGFPGFTGRGAGE